MQSSDPASAVSLNSPSKASLGAWMALAASGVMVLLLRGHSLAEPVDCDEAAYAYIGRRLLAGDRLYADVFENKPPLAYWIFAAGIALGGYQELTVRWLSVPFHLATLAGIWAITRRLAGYRAAIIAAFLFAIISHDPFTFGDTANLETLMNPMLTASLYAVVLSANRTRIAWPFAAGLALGLASLVKQVVLPHALLILVVLWFYRRPGAEKRAWWSQGLSFMAGVVVPWLAAIASCAAQGVVAEFFHAVFVYGPALVAESSTARGIDRLTRFLFGNPGVAWWATGIWPLFVLIAGSVIAWDPNRRRDLVLLLAWLALCFIEILLPGLYWQHYYLLAIPPAVILAACGVHYGYARIAAAWRTQRSSRRLSAGLGAAAILALLAWLCRGQYAHYLSLTPDELVRKHKDGTQWIIFREIGRKLAQTLPPHERIYVCGWESPIHFYSGLDSVTPYFFLDPFMVRYGNASHPLVEPRVRRIIQDLARYRPAVMFPGDQPLRQLATLARHDYQAVTIVPLPGETASFYVRNDYVSQVRSLNAE